MKSNKKDKSEINNGKCFDLLSEAEQYLKRNDIGSALSLYKQILEADPNNTEAQEGFRKAYAALVKEDQQSEGVTETNNQAKAYLKTLELLEAMITVLHRKYQYFDITDKQKHEG